MTAMNQATCGPCCVKESGCSSDVASGPCEGTIADGRYDGRGCLKCLLKYRCANIEFVPDAYSDACPSNYSSKMWYSCPYVWVNSGGPVSVSVELYRQPAGYACECKYKVTLSTGIETEVYEDIEADDLATTVFTIAGTDGEYQVEIGGAATIKNKLAYLPCSPCHCATCIPEKLLVLVTGVAACSGKDYCGTISLRDCVGDDPSITFDTPDGDIVITVNYKDISENSCGLNVIVTGPGVAASSQLHSIELESPPTNPGGGCEPITKVRCQERPDGAEAGSEIEQGVRGDGACLGETISVEINSAFTILDSMGGTLFTVQIRDNACGECQSGSPVCNGGCKEIDSYGLLCPPPDLVATGTSAASCAEFSCVLRSTGFLGGTPHPLQNAPNAQGFSDPVEGCHAFFSINPPISGGETPGDDVVIACPNTNHNYYIGFYKVGETCVTPDGKALPYTYRLRIAILRGCPTLSDPDTYVRADVTPRLASCSPPRWEFATGLTWRSFRPCSPVVGCCDGNEDEEIIITVTA
jgi:hypothetical protein